MFSDIPHFTNDNDVLNYDKHSVRLVNGIGSLPGNNLRARIYQYFIKLGYEFETIVANNSMVSIYAQLAAGTQVMPGAIIQTGVNIGHNCIINTGAIIEHDCDLGVDNHVAPGVTLCGQVSSKRNVFFGAGSSVIQSVTIGENVVIGAGSTITQNIEDNLVCFSDRTIKKVLNKNDR